jgi:hypothetical protein
LNICLFQCSAVILDIVILVYLTSVSDVLEKSGVMWDLVSLKNKLPDGLDDRYQEFFERIRKSNEAQFDEACRPLLALLVTMQEPLRVEDAQLILNERSARMRLLIAQISAMFPVHGDGDDRTFHHYHKSVVDWLSDEKRSNEL